MKFYVIVAFLLISLLLGCVSQKSVGSLTNELDVDSELEPTNLEPIQKRGVEGVKVQRPSGPAEPEAKKGLPVAPKESTGKVSDLSKDILSQYWKDGNGMVCFLENGQTLSARNKKIAYNVTVNEKNYNLISEFDKTNVKHIIFSLDLGKFYTITHELNVIPTEELFLIKDYKNPLMNLDCVPTEISKTLFDIPKGVNVIDGLPPIFSQKIPIVTIPKDENMQKDPEDENTQSSVIDLRTVCCAECSYGASHDVSGYDIGVDNCLKYKDAKVLDENGSLTEENILSEECSKYFEVNTTLISNC